MIRAFRVNDYLDANAASRTSTQEPLTLSQFKGLVW